MGKCQNDKVETWALMDGLFMAWEIGVKKIIVETNSITIYD